MRRLDRLVAIEQTLTVKHLRFDGLKSEDLVDENFVLEIKYFALPHQRGQALGGLIQG